MNFAEVICPLPGLPDKFFSKNSAIPIARYNVRLSNNGRKFSANAMPVTIYDSKCVVCDDKCKGRPGECSLKVTISFSVFN